MLNLTAPTDVHSIVQATVLVHCYVPVRRRWEDYPHKRKERTCWWQERSQPQVLRGMEPQGESNGDRTTAGHRR